MSVNAARTVVHLDDYRTRPTSRDDCTECGRPGAVHVLAPTDQQGPKCWRCLKWGARR